MSHVYAKQIFDIVKKHKGAYIWFYTEEGMKKKTVYVYPQNYLIKLGYHLSHLKKLDNTNDLSSFKLDILSTSKSVIAKIYHDLMKNNLNHITNLSHSSPRLIEVTPKGINKGYAIDYYANKYKIAKNEIVSMGDSFNDLSAFKNSALSIGINPKNPNLLEHCDAIVDHKSKGVSDAIRTYVLKDLTDMKYKLIFSDLDGTLLDAKTKVFSKQTKLALQQCSNHLIPIAIASGRSIYDGVRIAKQMELNPKTNVYVIGNNGATIFDIYTNKYISQTPLDEADARKIFYMMKEFAKKEKGNLGFMIHQHSEDILFYNEEF
ncbi:MAG: HAD-IIB family hydrolase [Mycoplasmoidaceae bacterium]|nr:HAD-IIB family hydrolase [Mycoplasmoidaceae bacterium]